MQAKGCCVVFFVICLSSIALGGSIVKTVAFANEQWNCSTIACTSRVREGEYQPNYQCAEFVSRSLVAGGFITGLTSHASQAAYEYYHHNGKTYDLLWVSSKQGGPLGLEDLLIELGWKNMGNDWANIHSASVLMCTGAEGPYSHVAIGVGNKLTNAHNMAHYHKPPSVYIKVDSVYVMP